MTKIALGTVQFGMDYGINNKRGKIPEAEVFEILEEAARSGIDTLDTSYGYGDAEMVLGCFTAKAGKKFNIVSRVPSCGYGKITEALNDSLKRLHVSSIYGFLVRDLEDYRKEPKIWYELTTLKKIGKIKKVGFTLYLPSDLDLILKNGIKPDIIQVPYSVFDQRFAPYFADLKKMGTEIHVRSVFLQGLVFKTADELSPYFEAMKEKLVRLHKLADGAGISVACLCLNFALLNEFVDKVLVGVDKLEDLKEIMDSATSNDKVKPLTSELAGLREENEELLLPYKWA
jgi:aryl-alcohol dehydrogenase-like predicted oxidoreductase